MFSIFRIFFSLRFIITIIAYTYIKNNKPNILNIPFEFLMGKTEKDAIIEQMSSKVAQNSWGVSSEMAEYLYLGIPFVALYIVVFIITKIIGFK